jgi:hypothetical protein
MTFGIGRRKFLGLLGSAASWPLSAVAQKGERVPPIGFLEPISANATGAKEREAAFTDGLERARSA